MSETAELSAEAVRLLVELLELPEPILSGAAAELDPALKGQLTAAGLLVPHDSEHVTTSMADHDDVPVSVSWSEQLGSLAYFSHSVGQIAVDKDALRRWRVGIDRMLAAATAAFDLQAGDIPFTLVDGLLWEIGGARLGRNRPRTPIWFARRLWDSSVQKRVQEIARIRPNTRQRVILTSSRAGRVRDFNVPGAIVVSLNDILERPNSLMVDAEILSRRLGIAPEPDVSGPINLSPDGKTLRINVDPPIPFSSEKQIAAIRRLVAAYRTGTGVRVKDVTDLGSLSRFFGNTKWKALSPYLKANNGLWSFEP